MTDPDYERALGRALFGFALLEWDAVWCAERIKPGFVNEVARLTAGQIAERLFHLSLKLPPSGHRSTCCDAATEFRVLVDVRNDLMHASPCTAPDGEQRLIRYGVIWSIPDIEKAVTDFAACSGRLNALLHGPLAKL